jgi:hypothetical protein
MPPQLPQVGAPYTYEPSHGTGYGHSAKGQPLSAEMTELDLKPGMEVVVHSLDADSDWPIIEWTDDVGLGRMTTIDPDVFDADFVPV